MDKFMRTGYPGMNMDIAKTLRVGNLVFMSGTEAMDPARGGAVPESMDDQIKVVVRKMNDALQEIGLSIENMVKHTIYMTRGSAEPIDVIRKFHDECYKYGPNLRQRPSTGTLAIIEGLAVKSFKIEVDAIAAYPD